MIKKLYSYRYMLSELIKRDFILKYKRTFLGVIWSLLSPMVILSVQILVFTKFFGSDIPHYHIFLFCGSLVYNYFTEATQGGLASLAENIGIFSKIPMPKYLFVFSRNTSALINFCMNFAVFLVWVALDGLLFTPKFFLLLYAVLCMVIFNFGVSLILGTLFIFFRDLSYLYNIFVLILMYLSATFYSVDSFESWLQRLYLFNPVYIYIKYFRLIVIDSSVPSHQFHLLMLMYSLVALVLGTMIYKQYNNKFIYYY